MKHAGGRPPKFNKNTIKQAKEYINSCIDKFELDMKEKKVINIGVNIPKAEGLAKYLGVRRETLYDWGKKDKEFSNILEVLNQEQCIRLIDGGLSGRYNSVIAKLVLAKHGYKEESKQEYSGNINLPALDQLTKELRKIAEE